MKTFASDIIQHLVIYHLTVLREILMINRIFTLQEAQALIPWLQELFEDIMELLASMDELAQEHGNPQLEPETHQNGASENGDKILSDTEPSKEDLWHYALQLLESATDKGIIIKDIQRGLVDFPSIRDGQNVYLCWMPGENTIMYWHTIESGFLGRTPI